MVGKCLIDPRNLSSFEPDMADPLVHFNGKKLFSFSQQALHVVYVLAWEATSCENTTEQVPLLSLLIGVYHATDFSPLVILRDYRVIHDLPGSLQLPV